jgi:hypothetical protein
MLVVELKVEQLCWAKDCSATELKEQANGLEADY